METIREDKIQESKHGAVLSITLDHTGRYRIIINGETWAESRNQVSAFVLYDLMLQHIAEYDF